MSLDFDPAAIELPICHHVAGRLVPAEAQITVFRPSDGIPQRGFPFAVAGISGVKLIRTIPARDRS